MQVKINGNRVDLSEIDRVLRAHGVIDATTVFYNNRIITFYVSKSINENKARQLIAQNLPRYMNPYRIIRMKDFPINNNGKVDRAKLIERLK